MFATVNSKYFDMTASKFVLMSPVNCGAIQYKTTITNVSLRVYELTTVADIDANSNGYIDSSEGKDTNGDGVINTSDYTAVNYAKGWTCIDLPTATFNFQDTTTSWVWS